MTIILMRTERALRILHDAAGRGTRAKPTVAELNELIELLTSNRDELRARQ